MTKKYKAYYTSGHGESSLSSEVTSLLTKSRISTSDLLLMTATSIPDDCDLLIIDGATSDFTKDEVKTIIFLPEERWKSCYFTCPDK